MSVQDLKRVKNSVIRNPVVKTALSRDAALVECVDLASVAGTVGNEIRVEAAHIIASLSYGSESALEMLLRLQTPRILIFALSQFTPTDPLPLRTALARVLRDIVASVAEIVGPREYGLRPETTGPMQMETKEALGLIFAIETLDIVLPLLLSPSPQLATPIVQLLASPTRSAHHRATLSSYLRPIERIATHPAKSMKRGWEKIASPTLPCASLPGAIATSPIAGAGGGGEGGGGAGSTALQEATMLGLVALAKENAGVAVPLARGTVYQPDLFGPPLALIHTRIKALIDESNLPHDHGMSSPPLLPVHPPPRILPF
ncbi:hypothetical protein DFP72DRAFT_1077675 [Ephemerocybe angulata]|uniref:Uncharacterized protein n=1 Tax=Ephemerocybe angulata TaxID=980116 RepID=A0A8H6HF08_9AGAR|nr:hypothetical protein DFP72DRAFT_1077675 [Tulosesus angulatus]